jgi:outer membrane protein OmpA-like peptidoglycan-associated protein/tetratricopeptide (TPR) repeat protein
MNNRMLKNPILDCFLSKSVIFLFIILIFSVNVSFAQKNIEYNKENFPENRESLQSAKRAIRKGDIYLDNEKYNEALTRYEIAQNFNPENSLINYKIGLCYFNTDQDSLARLAFEKAFSLNNSIAEDIHFYLARSNHFTCNFETAIDNYSIEMDSALKNGRADYAQALKKFISECQSGRELKRKKNRTLIIKKLSRSINSAFAEYSPSVSQDDSKMFFTARRQANISINDNEDIYFSTKVDSVWSEAVNIGKPINTFSNDAIVGISKDAKILYLYADENNGDIYFSKSDSLGWTEPEPFSDKINSVFTESSLCFSNNEDTLFFISNRTGTFGGKDIFYSIKQDNEWQTPVNIGYVINTEYDEESVFMYNDTLYFASEGHNSMGGYDIFKTFRKSDGNWNKPENLGFPVNSPYDDLFYISSKKNNYLSSDRQGGDGESDIYSITRLKPVFVSTKPDSLIRKAVKFCFVSDILFEVNKYQNVDVYPILDTLAKFLIDEPEAKISITGFTDIQGVNNYNLKLSVKRAEFVKQYIISKRVPESSLIVDGKGEEKQISKNMDGNEKYLWESLKYNRRVEFKVIKQGIENQLVVRQIEIPQKYQIPEYFDTKNTYSIWLMTYKEPVKINSFGLCNVFEHKNTDGAYDYYYGTFGTLSEAEEMLYEIRKKYPNSFIFVNDY